MVEMDGDITPNGMQVIDVIDNKYLIFQRFSWYWISQNLNLFRVDRVAVSPYIFIISDWRNNLVDNSRFIRIFGE
jgi:hypothetical protein